MRNNARRLWASTPQNCPTTNPKDFENTRIPYKYRGIVETSR